MSDSKKRSGFQITSVTSEKPQSSPSVVLTILKSDSSPLSRQGSSSQPTTPRLKRKYISQDALGQGGGPSSRFRVVRLAVGGAGGRGQPYCRGRWTCTDVIERQEVGGFRRVMDSMRHAHSLESLEMIGRDRGVDPAHVLPRPIRDQEETGHLVLSGPGSPTHPEPYGTETHQDQNQEEEEPSPGSAPHSTSPQSQNIRPSPPSPLQLQTDATGRSVLRLAQPCSPPVGLNHSPQTPASFSLDQTIFSLPGTDSSSNNSLVGIDNKIEQAMDLVKSHLMLAVREEVELMKEQIRELQEKNRELERENHILKTLTHSHTH